MIKKFFIFCLILVISFLFNISIKAASDINWHVGDNYVYNETQAPLKSLNLASKKAIWFAEDGGLQGVCLAGNDVIGAFRKSETNTDVEIFDKFSYDLKGKLIGMNLGHANDCAYNSKTGDIIFASAGNMIKKIKYDSNYNITKNEEIAVNSTSGVSSIAYDDDRNQYIVYRDKTMYITDLNFNIKSQFDVTNNLVPQGISYWKDHIYYVCDEFGEYSEDYQPVAYNSAEKDTSLVFVYDMSGNLVKVLYIPKNDVMPGNTSYNDFPELESVSFYDDGVMLLGFAIYYNYDKDYSSGYYKHRAFYTSDSVKTDTELTPLEKTITSISVSKQPDKTSYIQNYETLDLKGGQLTINYNVGNPVIIDLNDSSVEVSKLDNSTLGRKKLTVSYGGKTCDLYVDVVAKNASDIGTKVVKVPNTKGIRNLLLIGVGLIVFGVALLIFFKKGFKALKK